MIVARENVLDPHPEHRPQTCRVWSLCRGCARAFRRPGTTRSRRRRFDRKRALHAEEDFVSPTFVRGDVCKVTMTSRDVVQDAELDVEWPFRGAACPAPDNQKAVLLGQAAVDKRGLARLSATSHANTSKNFLLELRAMRRHFRRAHMPVVVFIEGRNQRDDFSACKRERCVHAHALGTVLARGKADGMSLRPRGKREHAQHDEHAQHHADEAHANYRLPSFARSAVASADSLASNARLSLSASAMRDRPFSRSPEAARIAPSW